MRCDPLSPGEPGKILDIMNFMNFTAGAGVLEPLEFAACHATSNPE